MAEYVFALRGAEEACQAQGLAFLPLVVESYGGWGEVARDVLHMGFRDRKKGSQGGAVGTVAVAAASDW